MTEIPIRSLTVSNFRCIKGTRVLPFDAPVVLIHGPNGTGKTSVLSALELALTGAVRSMERQSERYEAHLPYFGRTYATVRAEVADHLQTGTPGAPLTVGDSGVEGTPAFNDIAAKFYAERCYLDQASLGRLLELYEARSTNEQTALEQFVNELLGLEKLDALRDGLSDANDFRLLKKLAVGADEADRQAKTAAAHLRDHNASLAATRAEVADARDALRDTINTLFPGATDAMTDGDMLGFVRSALHDDTTLADSVAAKDLHEELIALGGRISALVERPNTQRISDIRVGLAAAVADRESWESTAGVKVRAWETAAAAAGANLQGAAPRVAVEQAMTTVLRLLHDDADTRAQVQSADNQLESDRAELATLQARLSTAREHSSALVEALTGLRAVINGNTCPVCDRDFTEIGSHSLGAHVDTKLAELTTHGQLLVELRTQHDQAATRLARAEAEYNQLLARLLPHDQRQALERRRSTLVDLSSQVADIEAARLEGDGLTRRVVDLQQLLEDHESASSEAAYIGNELARYAAQLQASPPKGINTYQAVGTELLERAEAEVGRLESAARSYRTAAADAERLSSALERERSSVQHLAELAERKQLWEDRFAEARRRQSVAREVHEAATKARTTIVNRVFSASLNDVWQSVFTRLAPNEGFIPRFGVPTATKKAFDIRLETTHRSGETSGPPQMMLSAGNLNTAALSLFLALHLAVDPVVRCLVFDDPVQAMDEVHVAQFAGLIRLLAKQNDRQVVIAVHERELFDYLTLELSPAYEGDELITIELGDRATDEDEGIIRHTWAPDRAIAG